MSHARKPRPPEPEPDHDQAVPVVRLTFDDVPSEVVATLEPGGQVGRGVTLPRALRALAKVLEDLEADPVPV